MTIYVTGSYLGNKTLSCLLNRIGFYTFSIAKTESGQKLRKETNKYVKEDLHMQISQRTKVAN